jgi:hypothetical protein
MSVRLGAVRKATHQTPVEPGNNAKVPAVLFHVQVVKDTDGIISASASEWVRITHLAEWNNDATEVCVFLQFAVGTTGSVWTQAGQTTPITFDCANVAIPAISRGFTAEIRVPKSTIKSVSIVSARTEFQNQQAATYTDWQVFPGAPVL